MKIAIAILYATALLSQNTPPLSTISGTITDAITHLPIRNVTVVTSSSAAAREASTGANGKYRILGIPPGSYWILVKPGDGYALAQRRVRIGNGEDLKAIDLELQPEAIIAGRVLDGDKNPVIGGHVEVISKGYAHARPFWATAGDASTNDLGEFRIGRLAPGRYYLQATLKPLEIRKRRRPVGKEDVEYEPVVANVPTVYASSQSWTSATPVVLRAGFKQEGLDIVLLKARTACVTSSVVNNNSAVTNETLHVMISENYPDSQSTIARGNVRSGEEIEVCGIGAGSYRLWSFLSIPGRSGGQVLYASEDFFMSGSAVRLPPIYLQPTLSVAGKVTVSDAKTDDPFPSKIFAALRHKDSIGVYGESTSASVDSSGNFVFPAAVRAEYWLEFYNLPSGFYIKEASMGTRDATREPVLAGGGDLRIVLGADGPSISGQVSDSDNQPVSDASVILAASPLPASLAPSDLLTTTADQNGNFTLNGMPPGNYRLLAFTKLADGLDGDPDFVRANLGRATELSLSPHETHTIQIKALPPPE